MQSINYGDSLDVWLKFEPCPGCSNAGVVWNADMTEELDCPLIATGDCDPDLLATYEANTYLTDDGYAIEWYHNDVGQVTTVFFDTLADAYDWYDDNGFEDYTS